MKRKLSQIGNLTAHTASERSEEFIKTFEVKTTPKKQVNGEEDEKKNPKSWKYVCVFDLCYFIIRHEKRHQTLTTCDEYDIQNQIKLDFTIERRTRDKRTHYTHTRGPTIDTLKWICLEKGEKEANEFI